MLSLLNNLSNEKIIVKPTIDTDSGKEVRLFHKSAGEWKDVVSEENLTLENLNKLYGSDFIVQEALAQTKELASYNPSSVNTIRLTVYRSILSDECHVTSAIFRVGAKGSFVDNAHSGGVCVGIYQDGSLCKRVLNQYGESTSLFNGIDFLQEHVLLTEQVIRKWFFVFKGFVHCINI